MAGKTGSIDERIVMPQRLKEEVRSKIMTAAAQVFAEHGFEKAKLSQIASHAGMATGSHTAVV